MGAPLKVMPGDRYGRLTITFEVPTMHKHRRFQCQCDCGREKAVTLHKLRAGNTRSCGCLQRESRSSHTRTHGASRTLLYAVWYGIKQRCYNERCREFPYYGARGISVDPEWQRFEPFRDWALANGYQRGLSIERIDNDGNYEPGNCKWIPRREQSKNTRKSLRITYNGRTQILKDWAAELSLPYLALYKRIVMRGWTVDRAFGTEVGHAH